jgi:hypothetical protein
MNDSRGCHVVATHGILGCGGVPRRSLRAWDSIVPSMEQTHSVGVSNRTAEYEQIRERRFGETASLTATGARR